MIAACPKCTARYRVDESRIGPGGAKLKCAKCQALFRVLAPPAPVEEAPADTPAPQAAAAPAQSVSPALQQQAPQSAAPELGSAPPSPADAAVVDRDRLVVVADSDVELGKATASQLSAWGLQPILVHDGVEAMLTIQRLLPRA
ncbi:MAG: zinc-ribbon domain-containing protein, partial [Deltaproteobacteria bacterium]|nr:zinc-ribbon domain-containing protein [Deltaproteobacteria bacterium]